MDQMVDIAEVFEERGKLRVCVREVAISAVYTKTSEDSPLRRLIVDIFLFLRTSKDKTARPPHRSYITAGWNDFCRDVDKKFKAKSDDTKIPWDGRLLRLPLSPRSTRRIYLRDVSLMLVARMWGGSDNMERGVEE
jgi:hypothetical protein